MQAQRGVNPSAAPASVTVRVVRGVWHGGRGVAPGEILVLTPQDAQALVAAGKAVRVILPLPALPPVVDEAPVAMQAREPVRRMRR
jgi:hypothetical protein